MDRPFRKEYRLDGTPEDVWEAFLVENNIEKWLASSSEMDDRIGFEFYWKVNGERMEGKLKELVRPYKKIIFDWKREQWDEGVFAEVELETYEVGSETELVVEIHKIPKGEWDEVYEDWNDEIVPKLQSYLKKLHKKKKAA